LKNAYDWLSRNGDKSKIYELPAAMVSSGGGNGGLNAQKSFRAIA
jgi:NAD(P)H-dependent FMN reductase